MKLPSRPSPHSRHEFAVDGANDSWSDPFAFVPVGSCELDAGCSTGSLGEALEKLSGCVVTGIDLHSDDIEVARTRFTRAEVVDAGAPAALSVPGSFDIVTFADVLGHLIDPHAARCPRRGTRPSCPGKFRAVLHSEHGSPAQGSLPVGDSAPSCARPGATSSRSSAEQSRRRQPSRIDYIRVYPVHAGAGAIARRIGALRRR